MQTMILYVAGSVDRAAALRLKDDTVAAALARGGARVVPVWRDQSVVSAPDSPVAHLLDGERARMALAGASHTVLLGAEGETIYVAADLSALAEEDALAITGGVFIDLREIGPFLPEREAHLLALARGMTYWHRRHGYCSDCGSPTLSQMGGHQRQCTNPQCRRKHFPRTDPAVIMLVSDDRADPPVCLLGRQASWPKGRFSTLAGFVEPGETLEQAVEREVFEETGIVATDVRYMASQPWPFPASLMLGFRARATTRDIRLNDNELEEAGWFTREQLRNPEAHGLAKPRPGSISRWLIQGWIDEGD